MPENKAEGMTSLHFARPAGRPSAHWRLSMAGMGAIGVTFGFARYGYGLFLPDFRAEFGLSVSTVGFIASATYAGYLVALLLVGALVARLGPRPLVVAGGLSATLGTGLVACARGPLTLTAGLVLAGTSSGWAWAPYSDAVDRLVLPERRDRVMGAIATGTAFAVAVTGPLAMLAQHTGWRAVWCVFAVVSLAVTVHNARVLPRGPHPSRGPRPPGGSPGGLRIRWFLRVAAVPLYLTAALYGLMGAVYWAFAVEAVSAVTGKGNAGVGLVGPLFWTLMGLAGTAGVFTGHAIGRFGLRRVHAGLFAGMGAAIALLGFAPGALPAVLASALLYGPCFMAGSGLLAVWSYQTFPEQPSTGFSATVLFLGFGTVIGPAVMGVAADAYGLRSALLATAALAAVSQAARPPSPVRP